jgi:hypothetical protein
VVAAVLALGAGSGCVGTTGSEAFELEAFAEGPLGAAPGEPYVFVSGRGYHVELTRAELHVGAVYLNQARAVSVAADTSCYLPGIYLAELPAGVDLDLLSGERVQWPIRGAATSGRVQTGEVWLTGGDVDAETDPTKILAVSGTASRDGRTYPFEGEITISTNRRAVPGNPATPGAEPICKKRIVSPIPTELRLSPGGALVLRVDPRAFFANVDFAALPPPDAEGRYEFADADTDPASANLFGGLRRTAAYSFVWER